MADIELQYQVLKQLQQNPKITQRQLAEILGVSLGKTNYLVKSLLDVGWLKLENFRKSDNKLGYIYLLTPKGIVEKTAITKRFLDRKRADYERLLAEIEALENEVSEPED